jgi:mannan polymerase II complex MNN10 subunit
MGEDTVPLLQRASTSLTFISHRFHSIATPRIITSKVFISICMIALASPILFSHRDSIKDLSVPYSRPFTRPIPQFIADGDTQCLPLTTPEMIAESVRKHATCRRYSPFMTGRARIATVTAHFGSELEPYQEAFRTHLVHSLIHGTEVRVMCDPIIDDLWNKPAFILNLLMREMIKHEKERLEWIMWVDRDTMILDQCRPMSTFLPPEKSYFGSWWGGDQGKEEAANITEVNLLASTDGNGLNNGVFLLRVNQWAISLFTAILAFRHYNPDVPLRFTEQSAMEHAIQTEAFKYQTQIVPQHWFNAYDDGGAMMYALRDNVQELGADKVRRGDYLVHFAGHVEKGKIIGEYKEMLQGLPDIWEKGIVQRDVDQDIAAFWERLGY